VLKSNSAAVMANSASAENTGTTQREKTSTKVKVAPLEKKVTPQGPDEKAKSTGKGSNPASVKNPKGQSKSEVR